MKNLLKKNRWWLLGAAWVYTLTFVFDHYWSESSSYKSIVTTFSNRINERLADFDAFCQDKKSIQQLLQFKIDSAEALQNNKDKHTYYYLYTDGPNGMQLKFWSNATVAPRVEDVPYIDTVKKVVYKNGIYIMSSRRLPHTLITAVQLILIKQQYEYDTTNTSLRQEYIGYPNVEEYIAISDAPTIYPVKDRNNNTLFYFKPIQQTQPNVFNWASLLVQVAVVIILLIFIYRVGIGLLQSKKLAIAFGWIFGTSTLLRICIGLFGFPLSTSNLDLFTPSPEAGFFVHSTGDLLLNLLLLVWCLHFVIRSRFTWLPMIENSGSGRRLAGAASIILLLPVTFWLSLLSIKLVSLPNITFNISSLLTLGWTLCAIACLYFICVIHYRLLSICNELYNHLLPGHQYLKFLLVALGGLIFLSRLIHQSETTILVLVLLWLLISLLVEDKIPTLFFASVEQSVRFVFWLIWYAFALSLMVQEQQQKKELKNEVELARSLVHHADNQAVFLINNALKGDEVAELIRNPALMEDSIVNQYQRYIIQKKLSRQLSGFKSNLYLFDSTSLPLYNSDSTSYEQLNSIVEQHTLSLPSSHDVYLYENTYEKFSYIIRKQLKQDSLQAGYLFITLTPAVYNTQAITPELFKPLRTSSPTPQQVDYAIYDDKKLFYSKGEFPFSTELKNYEAPKQQYELKKMHNKDVLWFNADSKRTILIVNQLGFFNQITSLFAYIFGGFVLLYLFEMLLGKIIIDGPWKLNRKWLFQPLTIRSKIRRTVILISVGSFFIIGITTVYFFIYRYESGNKKRLRELVAEATRNIQTADYAHLFAPKPASRAVKAENTPRLSMLAGLLNTDINLFDVSGSLTATSQTLVYEQGVISTKMNPEAYYQMAVQKQVQYLQQENIGNLDYLSIYVPLRSETGATLGYINIPSFASQMELNQEISNFLVTLINIIAFISIIAGIAAFFITNSITSSFYIIGQKMKAINLGEINEPIEWNRNDEIGILVEQYNKMLKELEESARKLASNEREYAWREMAKQVAHEIKNPLTPMKLNLQYLERQLQNKNADVGELAKRMTGTLVAQIDHLSQIASDFSQLARINVTHTEIFDLHQVLQQLVNLYQMDSDIELSWQKSAEPLILEADRTQINRLFTNLLKNASEARKDEAETAEIEIIETISATPFRVTIAITDHGSGIPEERIEQIFTPNFTTKTSGTGLGLAICKGIVESAGGNIWVESRTGGPTTFFVQLPLLSDVADL